jgi:hypothetical protein
MNMLLFGHITCNIIKCLLWVVLLNLFLDDRKLKLLMLRLDVDIEMHVIELCSISNQPLSHPDLRNKTGCISYMR